MVTARVYFMLLQRCLCCMSCFLSIYWKTEKNHADKLEICITDLRLHLIYSTRVLVKASVLYLSTEWQMTVAGPLGSENYNKVLLDWIITDAVFI